jgi:sulfofructose kinase
VSDLQIVGLGMSTLDVLMRLKDMPTWEHGTRISAFGFDGGGPVATAMAAAARLGARVGYIGTAGDDEAAAIKVRTLAKEGIHLEHLVVRPGAEKQIVLMFVDETTGERVFAGLGRFGTEPLRVEELDHDYITSAAYLHLDGMHAEAALQAARWMHAHDKKVSLDGSKTSGPISAEMRGLVAETDILICGQGFGRALTRQADLWEAGEAALGMGPDIVVQTEGADGSYTVTAQERFHTPAFQVPVVDTTGAGDVFHGAYLVGLLQGWELQSVARFATAVSALKCTQLGGRAGIPTFAQTLAFLRERGLDIT